MPSEFIEAHKRTGGYNVDYCKHCGGTGFKNGRYCKCEEGKFQKILRQGREKAKAKRETEEISKDAANEARESKPKKQRVAWKETGKEPEFQLTPYVVGDWVKVAPEYTGGGSYGYVIKVGEFGQNYRVKFIRYFDGRKINQTQWVEGAGLVPFPPDDPKEDLKALIDLAIDTGNKEWFLELTGRMK